MNMNIQTLNIECFKCRTITPGRRYTVGSAGAIFYVAGGASDDYAKVIKMRSAVSTLAIKAENTAHSLAFNS